MEEAAKVARPKSPTKTVYSTVSSLPLSLRGVRPLFSSLEPLEIEGEEEDNRQVDEEEEEEKKEDKEDADDADSSGKGGDGCWWWCWWWWEWR